MTEEATPATSEPAGYGSPAGVYERLEVRVPDIGEYENVPVIEVHVAPGDTISAEDPLLTLESDKATMDVPAPVGGTVAGVRVGVGDTVSEGDVIVELQTGQAVGDSPEQPPAEASAQAAAPAPVAGVRRGYRGRRLRPRCWCSGPGRAATAPPSGPPTSASRSCWWTARRSSAGSASTSAASPPRPCSTRPR